MNHIVPNGRKKIRFKRINVVIVEHIWCMSMSIINESKSDSNEMNLNVPIILKLRHFIPTENRM